MAELPHAEYTAEGGLLRAFASLEHATDGEIVDSARRWGLLREWAAAIPQFQRGPYRETCEHTSVRLDGTTDTACDSCRPETPNEWRETARLVRVLVDVLSYGGGPCPLTDVGDIPTHHLHVAEKRGYSRDELAVLRQHRQEFGATAVALTASLSPNWNALSRWVLSDDRLDRPVMSMFFGDLWPDSRYVTAFILSPWLAKTTKIWFNGTRCHLRANGLAGELAIQLVSLADGGQRVEACTNCADIFEPAKRRRRPGDASYCSACRARTDFEALKRRHSRARRRHRNQH